MPHVPPAERRAQLVRAAIDLMARRGTAAVSTRAIAAEAGVSQGTVHYAFGTKKDLYRALVHQVTADFIGQVRAAAPAGGSFAEQVRALVSALRPTTREEGDRTALLRELRVLAAHDVELRDAVQDSQHEVETAAAEMLTAIAEGSGVALTVPARDAAAVFLAGFFGLADRHRLLRPSAQRGAATGNDLLQMLGTALVCLCTATPPSGPAEGIGAGS